MSRLAVATTDALAILDRQALKDAPPSVTAACNFLAQPTAIVWSPDNSALFLSLPDAIEKYDPAGAHVDTIYPTPEPLSALLSKDKGNTLLFAARNEVTVLETHSRRVAHTFATHRHPVVGLALSSDATLLASICANAAHVYNLAQASHTVLRGFPAGAFTACAFHPHARTRLLLGIGLHVAVYDTARTSGPVKTINLEKGAGDVVAIASSPFSKTLVAVACTGGSVVLIDLEKEKGVIRTIPMQIPLTSLVFSPEGAALYAGTETGQILLVDLRSLDKPPRIISVSETGQPIICMSMQRKPKQDGVPKPRSSVGEAKPVRADQDTDGQDKKPLARRLGPSLSSPGIKKTASSSSLTPSKPKTTKLPTSPGLTRAQTLPSASTATRTRIPPSASTDSVPSPRPVRARAISSTTSASTPSSRVTSSTASRPATASSRTTVSTSTSMRKVSATRAQTLPFSPPKSPLSRSGSEEDKVDVSMRVENLLGLPKARRTASLNAKRDDEQMISTATTSRVASRVSTRQGIRTRTVSATATSPSATATASTRAAAAVRSRIASASAAISGPSRASSSTTPTATTATIATANAVPTKPPGRPTHAKRLSTASSVDIPTVNVNGSRASSPTEQLTAIRLVVSRTPSPDFAAALVPVPLLNGKGKGKGKEREKRGALDVLGLGTPAVREWVAAGALDDTDDTDADEPRARGRVGFLEPDEDGEEARREVQIQSIEVLPPENGTGTDKDREKLGGGGGVTEEATIKMTVQISPRRPAARLTPSASPLRAGGPLPGPGPSLSSSFTGAGLGTGAGGGTSAAHDLLHALVRDALYDFRRETRAELIGLHLDVVKMGRGWRREMREALERWSAELQEVREENRLLREENERLRRGY